MSDLYRCAVSNIIKISLAATIRSLINSLWQLGILLCYLDTSLLMFAETLINKITESWFCSTIDLYFALKDSNEMPLSLRQIVHFLHNLNDMIQRVK